jgi:hypothetical protein
MNQDYIANCIHRALMECAPSKFWELSKELADIVRLADSKGTNAAHGQLIEVLKKAEEGFYK